MIDSTSDAFGPRLENAQVISTGRTCSESVAATSYGLFPAHDSNYTGPAISILFEDLSWSVVLKMSASSIPHHIPKP
jgi:hypothetical protein